MSNARDAILAREARRETPQPPAKAPRRAKKDETATTPQEGDKETGGATGEA